METARSMLEAARHEPARCQYTQLSDRLSRRAITAADRDFLLALFAESRPELRLVPEPAQSQLIGMPFDLQLNQYRSRAADAVDWILELEHDGRMQPVGRCYIHRGREEHRLLDVAMRSQWRGQGLGSVVLARLCADAAQAGVPLRLTVWVANHAALRLYRRLGFVVDDAETDHSAAPSGLAGYLQLRWSSEGRP